MSDPKNDGRSENRDEQTPANPGVQMSAKSQLPDPDRTEPGTLPGKTETGREPIGEARATDEHAIGHAHAEPTDVTETTNDNFIERQYIDVGGGD